MPMAHEARKPVFHLKSSDGAIGARAQGVEAGQAAVFNRGSKPKAEAV